MICASVGHACGDSGEDSLDGGHREQLDDSSSLVGTVRIVGTDGDDVICVPDRDDRRAFHVIDAKGGNDIVLAGAGVDLVYAGAGTDTVYAGGGSDHIDAGAGADVVYGGSGFDTVYSTDLADTIHDDPDGSELIVSPTETVAHAAPVASADWHHVDVSAVAGIDVSGNDYDTNDNLDPSTLRITRQPASGAARVVLLADGAAAAVELHRGRHGRHRQLRL